MWKDTDNNQTHTSATTTSYLEKSANSETQRWITQENTNQEATTQ